MRFLTDHEAKAYAERHLGSDGLPVVDALPGSRTQSFEAAPGYTYFARAKEIVESLGYFDWCLLWVVEWGVWASNENLHLYYRVRESYGDNSHLAERPAALALRHEVADVVTLVHLGMMFGWDMYLLTSPDYGRAFISHDGYFQLGAVDAESGEPSERPAT